jgi:hypothetical protein
MAGNYNESFEDWTENETPSYPERDRHGLTEWEKDDLTEDTMGYHTAEFYKQQLRICDPNDKKREKYLLAAIQANEDISEDSATRLGFLGNLEG